ncbi:MAG: hypothetical protein DI537_05500 [Stutzerimonas stutzeri]|nr:MAG: hypothetical protein DI537_05500 [Stutzerimonas stutzeri]
MKPFAAFALLAALTASSSAFSQVTRWQDMSLVDLGASPLPAELSVWDEMIARNDQRFKADIGTPKTKTGRAPALIRWRSFDVNGDKIVVSIFHGLAANCDAGANSSGSDQSWATCPARITVIKNGQVKTSQTTACFNGFPLGPTTPAPDSEKTLVALDAANSRIQLKASNGGKDAPGCARSVKIPL